MKDQDIDKLFKDGLSGANFPFSEGAWASAEKAIIAHEASKRRRGIIYWFLAGLLLISSGLGIYNYNSYVNEVEAVQNSNPKNTGTLLSSNSLSKEQESFSEKTNSNSNPKQSTEKISKTESAQFKSGFSDPSNGRTQKLPPVFLLEKDVKATETNQQSINSESVNSPKRSLINADFLALRYAKREQTKLADALSKSAGNAGEIYLPDHWNTKVNLIIGAMPLDYNSSGEAGAGRLPYYGGLGISKIYNYSLELGAAVLFEELAYAENEKTIEQIEYGFGKTVNTYRIKRSRGNYLSLPIYMKYRIRNNHAFMAGVQYSRLLQSYSSFSTESENSYLNNSSIAEEKNISGYNNDLSDNQVSLILGYDLTLSDRLRFQVLGRLGGNSLYKNEINKDSFSDRVHLRIGIEYSIWRF